MIKDLKEYLEFLYSIGKTTCCNHDAEKQSEIMTQLQQEMLAGYIILAEENFEHYYQPEINYKLIAKYLISNSEADGKAVLDQIKNEIVEKLYSYTKSLVDQYVAVRNYEKKEEAGLRAEVCQQSGETVWVK